MSRRGDHETVSASFPSSPSRPHLSTRFWERTIRIASAPSQRRFIQTFDDYCQSVVQQAADRDTKHIRDVESYMVIRRENIGAKPSFALLELDMDLPDEVLEHPAVVDLTTWAIDMIIIGNVSHNTLIGEVGHAY